MSFTPTAVSEVDFEGNPTAPYDDTVRYDDATVAYWRMNDAATLTDELGVNDGTMHGGPVTAASLLDLDADLALTFDGVDDYASVPVAGSLQLAGSWSVHGLVKVPSLPGATKVLWTRGALKLRLRADGKVEFSVANHVNGSATLTTLVSVSAFAAGDKLHLICVHDADQDQLRLYVNGMREDEAAHSVGTEIWSLPFLFGAGHGGTVPVVASVGAEIGRAGGNPGAAFAVPAPAGVAVGDLLVAWIFIQSGNGVTDQTVALPPGWKTLIYDLQSTSTLSGLVAYKFADAGDVGVGSFTFTYSGTFASQNTGRGRMLRVTGADTSHPFANPPYMKSGVGTAVNTGTNYPGCDDTLALCLVAMDWFASWASAETELFDTGGTGTPGTSSAGYSASVADASAGKAFAVTASAAHDWFAASLFVKGPDAQDFADVTMDEWGVMTRAFDDDDALDLYTARLSGEGTLTDVTADSQGFKTTRGRQYELDKIEAGTLQETLLDLERKYDPANNESPYYPHVVTKRRKVNSADVDGTIVPLYHGYVERWPQQWATAHFAQTGLTATDGLTPLAVAPVDGLVIPAGASGAQIHRLLDKAKWPRDLRAIDDGVFTMADWTLDPGSNAKDAIEQIADSELGLFFISAAGVATFHDNAHRYTAARSLTPQAVFSDDEADIAGGALRYINPVPGFDDDHQATEWQVSDARGNIATERDVVAGRQGFPAVKTRSTRLDTTSDAAVQARALIGDTARAAQRFDAITVSPDTSADWLTVLSLDISDRVTVIANPVEEAAGTPIALDCFVEGVEVDAQNDADWTVTLQLSAVAPSGYFDTIFRDGPVAYYRMDETP